MKRAMTRKRHRPEEIVAKLREVDEALSQGKTFERIGARERSAQASGCGSSTRHSDLERGGQGGILSPALRRRAIQHVTTIFSISQRACAHSHASIRDVVGDTCKTCWVVKVGA